ncbi:uncharacterized protein LOC142490664 [Ascaphus truei]|uniref:uncharacterized protein LOC142490664 n=1 Tax=Ascaphus truei TaxID=8439 RepID=UPI003F5990A6
MLNQKQPFDTYITTVYKVKVKLLCLSFVSCIHPFIWEAVLRFLSPRDFFSNLRVRLDARYAGDYLHILYKPPALCFRAGRTIQAEPRGAQLIPRCSSHDDVTLSVFSRRRRNSTPEQLTDFGRLLEEVFSPPLDISSPALCGMAMGTRFVPQLWKRSVKYSEGFSTRTQHLVHVETTFSDTEHHYCIIDVTTAFLASPCAVAPAGRCPKCDWEEQGGGRRSWGRDDVDRINPLGLPSADVAHSETTTLRCTKPYKIGTWNVNGLNTGKLDIVKRELNRLNIYILGISEIHWTGNGFINSGEHMVYYSGIDTTRRRGVGFIVNKKIAKATENYQTLSDRIMAIRIRGKPSDITVLQIYSPIADAPEEEVEEFYGELQDALNQTPNMDIIYIIGDFNSKVGTMEEPKIVGRFCLGVRNEAGDRLVQFCQEHRLTITNTWFEQPKRRLYTWTSPSREYRNQIDYILCQKKWQSSILAVKTYRGADCGSDHQLLVATVKLQFCNTKPMAAAKKFDTDKISPSYAVEVNNRFDLFTTKERQPNEMWEEVKACVIETALEHRLLGNKLIWGLP